LSGVTIPPSICTITGEHDTIFISVDIDARIISKGFFTSRINNEAPMNIYSNQTLTEEREKTGRHFAGRLLACILLLCAGGAMAGEHHTFIPGQTRPGKFIFHNYCSVCHGDKGDGQSRAREGLDPPPRNYTTPEAALELTRERMISSVTNGRPGTAMIAWGKELSPKEIEGVVDYVRSTFMKLGNQAAGSRPRPNDKLLASRGGVIYLKSCAMCHGETGTRETTGRMQPPPRDFTTPQAATELTHGRMIASITNGRPGTAMIGYGTQLSKADIEALADFIREAYMSGPNDKK
jgi:cbb3-type cytochrome c oxidase subunit III